MAAYTTLNKIALAATGSTGNLTGATKNCRPGNGFASPIAVQFVVEAIGATPTADFKAQGSMDGSNWYDLAYITNATSTLATAAITIATVSASLIFLENSQSRGYNFFRGVVASNTNVTYRIELWVESI